MMMFDSQGMAPAKKLFENAATERLANGTFERWEYQVANSWTWIVVTLVTAQLVIYYVLLYYNDLFRSFRGLYNDI